MQRLQERAEEPDRGHEERRHNHAKLNAVHQGAVAVFAFTGAEGLGDESVQADQQPAAEKSHDIENAGADADRTDGAGAIGQMADHDGVDDAHGHPADLREDQRQRKVQRRAHFGAKCFQAEHGSAASLGSVSGEKKTSKPSRDNMRSRRCTNGDSSDWPCGELPWAQLRRGLIPWTPNAPNCDHGHMMSSLGEPRPSPQSFPPRDGSQVTFSLRYSGLETYSVARSRGFSGGRTYI